METSVKNGKKSFLDCIDIYDSASKSIKVYHYNYMYMFAKFITVYSCFCNSNLVKCSTFIYSSFS